MPDATEALQRHAYHYHCHTLLNTANEQYVSGGEGITQGLSLFDAEWENIQSGQAWAAAQIQENTMACELASAYAINLNIINLRIALDDGMRWSSMGIQAAQILKNHQAEAGLLNVCVFLTLFLYQPWRIASLKILLW